MADTDNPDRGWEIYPDVEPAYSSFDYDSGFYRHRFDEDAPRLFSRQADDLTSYFISTSGPGCAEGTVPTVRECAKNRCLLS
jgi:hypothetical protein